MVKSNNSLSRCKDMPFLVARVSLMALFMVVAGSGINVAAVIGDEYAQQRVGRMCIESEKKALLEIKKGLYVPDDKWLSSWGDEGTGDCCTAWAGVECDNATGHVIKLDLRSPYPNGPGSNYWTSPASKLSPSLFNLTHLKYLDLSMNNFHSAPIPDLTGSLANLEYLNLSSAWFNGAIPPQLGNLSCLQSLDLGCPEYVRAGSLAIRVSYTLYAGDLGWLSKMTSLRYLDLSGANLSIAVDWFHSINMLPSLSVLKLAGTMLPTISSLPSSDHYNLTPSLTTLDLSEQDISSVIGNWLLNISSRLEHLYLDQCQFQEGVSISQGHFSNLKTLSSSGNRIGVEMIEKPGSNFGHLEYLDLSYNKMDISIERLTRNLTNLRVLRVHYCEIAGNIPETLGNLSQLEHLDMSDNMLTGAVPGSIGNLHRLSRLYLSDNQINGISETIGNLVSLKTIDLSNNLISGEIPGSFSNLSLLEDMDLSNNNISGRMPKAMGNLHNLGTVDIHNNSICGELPSFNSSRLMAIDLSHNSFSGPILSSLTGISWGMEYVWLSANNLTGDIPSFFCNMTSLESLEVSSNNLYGKIPPCSGWGGVRQLDLSRNNLTSNIPSFFCNMTSLEFLAVSNNNLYGKIPPCNSWGGVSYLILSQNHLTGNIPYIFCNMTSLQGLFVSGNNLHGEIPQCKGASYSYDLPDNDNPSLICNLPQLQYVNMSMNSLSGEIPSCQNKSSPMMGLDLSNNRFSGSMPDTFRSFASLESLHLSGNNISGEIPLSLKYCGNLVLLDLSRNNLCGSIPSWIGESLSPLRVLSLRSNLLSGTVPMQLSYLSSLQVLDLSSNRLSGWLSLPFENFRGMITSLDAGEPLDYMNDNYYQEDPQLTVKGIDVDYTSVLSAVTSIDLSSNNFHGVIPNGIVQLHGLCFLNLSQNHFTGKIPKDIGALRQLQSLDLSRNDLSGEIPSSMIDLYFLSKLNVSENNLSGRVPSGNQFLSFDDPSIYSGNPYLCGWPLLPCVVDLPHDHPNAPKEQEDGDDPEMIWIYGSAALGFIASFWAFIGTLLIKKSIRFAYFRFVDKLYDWIVVEVSVNIAKVKSIMAKSNRGH